MNNLDSILSKIEEAADDRIKKETDAIIAKAESEAAAIVADAEKTASEFVKKAKRKSEFIKEASVSSCDGYIARRLLKEKSDIIKNCISHAAAELKNAKDEEYFDMIKKLILKYAQSGSGELILNKTDNGRLPAKFIDDVNLLLKERNADIVLSKEIGSFDSGFVLRYGGIDENCTFDALIKDKADEIRDAICRELKEG